MMKRYLEKMVSVLKTDGIVAGSVKIAKGLWATVKYSASADVLFISSGAVGSSWMYRVRNVSEELGINGISSSITIQENIWLDRYAGKFKIFIFHKVSVNDNVRKLIAEIKAQKKEMIFETDDLVFDYEKFKNQDFFKNLGEAEKKFYESLGKGEILGDPYLTTCTTTTSFLAEKLRECGKQVFIVPNKISKKDLKIADKIINYRREVRDTVRIGYFSGTLSHDRDFATVHDVMVKIMEKYPMVELYLVGPLSGVGFSDELNKFRDRIKKLPFASREKHFMNIASVDINIAPLEDNPFCEAKSELKFFEAGIVRIPTVAFDNSTYREAIKDGEDGFVAKDSNEWFEKLEKLIVDKDFREIMGDNARKKAIEKYSTLHRKNEEYYAYLKSRIK